MLKYIMNEKNVPILFPEFINHDEMARRIGDKIISAGFVSFSTNKDGDVIARTHGYSITLNLDSREEDAKIINRVISI